MTQSFMHSSNYPFGVIEEETKSMIGREDVKRVSMSVHSHNSSDSFVSAPDSPNAQKRHMLEQKLRIKKQKQAEKKFSKIKSMKNPALVGKEFGNLADLRASDIKTIQSAARAYNNKVRRTTDIEAQRKSKIEIKDENYFNRHFAHTPTAA